MHAIQQGYSGGPTLHPNEKDAVGLTSYGLGRSDTDDGECIGYTDFMVFKDWIVENKKYMDAWIEREVGPKIILR